jgi:hypothetical protein
MALYTAIVGQSSASCNRRSVILLLKTNNRILRRQGIEFQLKTKQHNTYKLLLALDGNEAQYIRKRLTANNLRILFDEFLLNIKKNLSAAESEKILLKKHKLNSLRVAQNHLYNEVLRQLTYYHSADDMALSSYSQLQKVDILRYKNLFQQYEQALQQNLKATVQQGNLSLACEYATRLLGSAGLLMRDNSADLVQKYSAELQRLAQAQHTLASLKAAFYHMVSLLSQNRFALQQEKDNSIALYETQLKHAVIYTPQFFEIEFYYHSVRTLIYALQFDHEQLHQNAMLTQVCFQNHGNSENLLAEYLVVLNTYVSSRFLQHDFGAVLHTLEQVGHIRSRNPLIKATQFGVLYCNRSRYEATNMEYDSLKKTVRYIATQYEQHVQYLSADIKGTLYCNCLIANFILEQYESCRFWHGLLNDMPKKSLRKDASSFVRVFLLIVYITNKDFDSLEKQYRKIKREISTESKPFKSDTYIMQCAGSILKGKSVKECAIKLGDQLVSLLNDEYESLPLRYFNMIAWCKSVERGLSYQKFKLLQS